MKVKKPMQILSVTARKMLTPPWWQFWKKRPATPNWRPYAHRGTDLNTYDAFKTYKLLKRSRVVDAQGRWWVIEERQHISTGLIIRRSERITD